MRMTNLTMERNFLYNVGVSEDRLQRLQDQASSGMKFQKPEDDPVGVQRSMSLRHDRVRNEQYLQNLSRAKSWMEYTEKALADLTGALNRANEIGLRGVTGTTPQDARDAIAAEVLQLREEVESLKTRTMEAGQSSPGLCRRGRLEQSDHDHRTTVLLDRPIAPQ